MKNNKNNIPNDIAKLNQSEIEKCLSCLPQGTLTYKKIRGKEQPYLQRTEKGKSKSAYIKIGEREEILELLEKRNLLQNQLKRLKAYGEKYLDILQKNPFIKRDGGIGYQHFDRFMEMELFYVDKTKFISEWWKRGEIVTLLTRPRRFGKTLLLSTVDNFFSVRYTGRSAWFNQLAVGKDKDLMKLQGSIPVIFMTFAGIKANSFSGAVQGIARYMAEVYDGYRNLLDSKNLTLEEKEIYENYYRGLYLPSTDGEEKLAYCHDGLKVLSELLYKHYKSKAIILIDEYDTPLVEAYTYNYWEQMTCLMRTIFNTTLKTNNFLERALLTGITRVVKESLFSDLNNIEVISITTELYEDCCGFTEEEVIDILAVRDSDEMNKVREFYDGFTFGKMKNIYNPWSIVNFIDLHQFKLYWGHSGGYGLLSDVVLHNEENLLPDMQKLLSGKPIHKNFDESFSMQELYTTPGAVWALMLATGYVKAENVIFDGKLECDLSITNKEALMIFDDMVKSWYKGTIYEYESFIDWLIKDDLEGMNHYMNNVVLDMTSVFDVGGGHSRQPEKFYHGLVLGLIVELRKQYEILSNRESGFGRFDVMLKPKEKQLDGIIFEFKVCKEKGKNALMKTAIEACQQIDRLNYEKELLDAGVTKDKIRKYGFAFRGKEVLIMK